MPVLVLAMSPVELSEEEYSEATEKLAKEYGPKALALLGSIAQRLREEGFVVGDPGDLSCDDFKWGMLLRICSKPEQDADDLDMDISVELAESLAFEGSTNGVTFALDAGMVGGEVVTCFNPWNYTERCWVDVRDPAAIKERWDELLSCEDEFTYRVLERARKVGHNG